MKILNFGSLNIDKTYSVPHIVQEGETISSLAYQEFVGGKGLNQSIAIARAGGEVWHAGLIGQEDGDILLQALKESGVHTEFVEKRPIASGHTIIQVDQEGRNSIIVSGGANRAIDEPFIDKVLSHFSAGDLLLLQNEVSCFSTIIDKAHNKGLIIYLNPSPMDSEVLSADLNKIDCFLINEIEGQILTGEKESTKIMEAMRSMYPKASLVLTLGAEGAYFQKDGNRFFSPSVEVHAIDTTGAGDTFCGYFIASVTKGEYIKESLRKASRAASLACTIKGASNSIPMREDID